MKTQNFIKNKLNLFTLFLLLTSCFLLLNPPKAEVEELVISVTPNVSPTPTSVAYMLPYPGLLPGHFFYPLKEARDNLMGLLISNSLKKAEFDFLQADKRVEGARLLFVQKNTVQGQQTFSKALNYFEDALKQIAAAKKQGMDTADIGKRLKLAVSKYKEIVKGISQDKGNAKTLANEIKRLDKLEQAAKKL